MEVISLGQVQPAVTDPMLQVGGKLVDVGCSDVAAGVQHQSSIHSARASG